MCYLFTLKHLGLDMVLSLQRGKLVKNQSGSQLTSCTTLASGENSSKERGRGGGEGWGWGEGWGRGMEMKKEQISCLSILCFLRLQMTSGIQIGNWGFHFFGKQSHKDTEA